jgi:transposase/predicted nucleic acid-binding Zn finger protein
MADWKLLDREQRGMILAATAKIVQRGKNWVVPSQSGDGTKYTVCVDEQSPSCSCPDYALRGSKCKHLVAVEIVRQRELFDDGTEVVTERVTITESVERKTYGQAWSQYNRAQVSEKDLFQQLLAALCQGVQEPPAKATGRPRIAAKDAVFSACFKVFSTLSARRFMCDLKDAHAKGYVEHVPHFNSILNHLDNEQLTPILNQLIERSAMPLAAIEQDFAADSTGFTTSRFYKWIDHKYGAERKEHDWVKVHLMVGVVTHVVTAAEIHERNTNDSPILPSLLDTTAKNFKVSEVSADNQYSSERNLQAIASHGATAYIPFRSNATGGVGGLYAKAFHFFSLHRDEFMAHYHKRSNIESANSMIKRKTGDAVRSKTDLAMKNEALCKILAHNICCLIQAMHEFGVRPDFCSVATYQATIA